MGVKLAKNQSLSGGRSGSLGMPDGVLGRAGRDGPPLIQDSPTGLISAFALTQDGQSLALGGNRGIVVVDAATFEPRWFSPLDSTVMSLAFSPDGALLASVQLNSAVVLWDARTGTSISVLLENGGTS